MARAVLFALAAACLFAAVLAVEIPLSDLKTPISNAIFNPASVKIASEGGDGKKSWGYYRRAPKKHHKKDEYKEDEHKGEGYKHKEEKEYKDKAYNYKPKSSPSPPPPKPSPPPKHEYKKDEYKKDEYKEEKYEGEYKPEEKEYHVKDGYYYDGKYTPKPYYDSYKDGYEYKEGYEYEKEYKDYSEYGGEYYQSLAFPKICLEVKNVTTDAGNNKQYFDPADVAAGNDFTFTVIYKCCKDSDEPKDYDKDYGYGYGYDYPGGGGKPPGGDPDDVIGTCTITLTAGGLPEKRHENCYKWNITGSGTCTFSRPSAKECIPFGHYGGGDTTTFDIEKIHLFELAVGYESHEPGSYPGGDYYGYGYNGKYMNILSASNEQIASMAAAKASIASSGAKPSYAEYPPANKPYYAEDGGEYYPAPYPPKVKRGKAFVLCAHLEDFMVCEDDVDCHKMKAVEHGIMEYVLEVVDQECEVECPAEWDGNTVTCPDCHSKGPVVMAKCGQTKIKAYKPHSYGYDNYGYDYKGYEEYKKYEKTDDYKKKKEEEYKKKEEDYKKKEEEYKKKKEEYKDKDYKKSEYKKDY